MTRGVRGPNCFLKIKRLVDHLTLQTACTCIFIKLPINVKNEILKVLKQRKEIEL